MTRSPLFLTGVLFAACGGGTTVVDPPPPPADAFTFTFRPDAEDQASAQALGWGTVVPDADVIVTPKDPALGGPQSHRTTATGTVAIAKLTAGDYVVEAKRLLSDTERGRLTAGDDAIGFVSKTYLRVASGGGQTSVAVPASRRGTLVISEFANNRLDLIPDAYYENAYVELYNNADTTIYVDGMLLSRALSPSIDPPTFPCALYYQFSRDPGGVWARWYSKFPGTGRDFPVPPGGTIVVATDAIDHGAIVAGGLDLRFAQFEMIGPADVDNPSVPNMIEISDDAYSIGHGQDWAEHSMVATLVMPVSFPALARTELPPAGSGTIVARAPRERILDVLTFHTTYVGAYANCPSMVHNNFDRAMAFLMAGDQFFISAQRRTAVVLPGGRKILQNTRSSDADYLAASRSPGTIP